MKLGYVPNVYINQDCMLTTPFDMMANQIIEENRGKINMVVVAWEFLKLSKDIKLA